MRKHLFPIVLTALIVSTAPQPVWSQSATVESFRSDSGGFSIQMPSSPDEEVRTVESTVGPVEAYLFTADQGNNGVFMVTYADYPESLFEEKSPTDLLDAARDGGVAASGGKLLAEESITLDQYPGRYLTVEFANGAGQSKVYVYLVGRRLYQILWTGPQARASFDAVDTYLNSFELLE